MYERFTDRARKVLQLGNQEAQRLNHESMAPEHLLVGLVKEGSGLAAHVLKVMGVELATVRRECEKTLPPGGDAVVAGRLPQTPELVKVIEQSIEAARERGDNWVGTEHLLFGLLRFGECPAYQFLAAAGVTLEKVTADVDRLIGRTKATPEQQQYVHASLLLRSCVAVLDFVTLPEDGGLKAALDNVELALVGLLDQVCQRVK